MIFVWLIPEALTILALWLIFNAAIAVSPDLFGIWDYDLLFPEHSLIFLGLMLVAFMLPTFIHTVLRYLHFSYMLTDDAIIRKEGIIHVKRRAIPYSSIQNLTTRQPLLYRLLGIFEIRIETAGPHERLSKVIIPGVDDNMLNLIIDYVSLVSNLTSGNEGDTFTSPKAAEPEQETTNELLKELIHETRELRKEVRGEEGGTVETKETKKPKKKSKKKKRQKINEQGSLTEGIQKKRKKAKSKKKSGKKKQ